MWSSLVFLVVALVLSSECVMGNHGEHNGLPNTDFGLRKGSHKKCLWKDEECSGGDCCKGYECVLEYPGYACCKKKSKCKKNEETGKDSDCGGIGKYCDPAKNNSDCCQGTCQPDPNGGGKSLCKA